MASIQGIYVALFGRPADPTGLAYFNSVTKNGADLSAIGNLAGTAEYQSRFTGFTNEQIVNSIYQSLFGRSGETAGVQFWVQQLQQGKFTINNIAIAILDGAQGSDLQVVNAKIAAADLFTSHLDLPTEIAAYVGTSAAQIGRDYITSITKDNVGTSANADAAILKLLNQGGQTPTDGGGTTNPGTGGGDGGGTGTVDKAPVFTNKNTDVSIAENTKGVIEGYKAVAVDPEGATVSYSLDNDFNKLFSIDSKTGVISINSSLDYEGESQAHSYTLSVVASDGSNTDHQSITVNLTDVNEAPVFSSTNSDVSIAENTKGEIAGYQASAADPEGATVTYSLQDDQDGLFSINSETGVISLNKELDYDAKGQAHSYTLTVVASDNTEGTPLTTEQTITVKITDVNEAPVFTSTNSDVSIAENTSGDISGYQASASDPEGATVTYSLQDDKDGLFSINSETGVISLNKELDYDAKDQAHSYTLTVVASDNTEGTPLTAEQTITVKITDVDEAPAFTSTNEPVTVAENASGEISGYKAVAADPEGVTVTYSLQDDQDGRFSINSETGVISTKGLDYENSGDGHSYTLTVVASDATSHTTTQTITVNVTDVNEAPVFSSTNSDVSIAENTKGEIAGYTAVAADPEGATVTYSLQDDQGGLFSINSETGIISLTKALDYEAKDQAKSFDLIVIASDSTKAGAMTTEQTIKVNLTNVDEAPVFSSTNADVSIAENTKGEIAGYQASASDPEGATVTYSLSNDFNKLFSINSETGVISTTGLDYENSGANHSYSLTVVASDGTSHTTTQAITVKVTNVDEAPVFTSTNSDVSIAENTKGEISGYKAVAADPEGATVTYALKDNQGGLFSIDSSSGVISLTKVLDYEAKDQPHSYNLTVVASDNTKGGALTTEQTIKVNLTNVDEAPVFSSTNADVSIAENTKGEIAGYQASASDPEGATVTYSLSNDFNKLFSINSETGVISTTGLDYENSGANHSYSLTVVASDGTSHTTTQAITVKVTNVDEAPVFTSTNSDVSIAENTKGEISGYQAAATDPENAKVTYSLKNDQGGLFSIDKSTGVVSTTGLDYENSGANHSYSLTVVASDATSHTTTQTIKVNVTDVAETGTVYNGTGGNDIIDLSSSKDTWVIDGGNGTDTIILPVNNKTDKILLATTSSSVDTINNFEPSKDKLMIDYNKVSAYSVSSDTYSTISNDLDSYTSSGKKIVSVSTFGNSVIEFSFDAGNGVDLNTSSDGSKLFDAITKNGAADLVDVSRSWAGYFVAYDTSSQLGQKAAYIYYANDANNSSYLDASEVSLVAKVVGVDVGALSVSNFEFAA